MATSQPRIATVAVRTGQQRTAEGEHNDPIFLTSSYVFTDAAQAAARFAGEDIGNVYSRYTNPTVRTFEERLAAMEGAQEGVATASGMAAVMSLCLALLKTGDHIICARNVFGTTVILMQKYLSRLGIEVSFVHSTDIDQWRNALRPQTRLLFLETPSNPMNDIADLSLLAQLAHDHRALLVVDNCFCTPVLQRPLDFGADLIVHSATKYLDGQGRCVGGAVLGNPELMAEVRAFLRTAGPTMSAFNAWIFLHGLETLSLRMRQHSDNALRLAEWLVAHDKVQQVWYAGLESHANHHLALRQQSGFGAVIAFTVAGGRTAAWQVIDRVQIMSLTANLGDAKTTIIHPATTTHGRLTPEERQASGVSDNLIRIAVGLEDCADLQDDLQQALASLTGNNNR